MISLFLGRRTDGTAIVLARPHGGPRRAGSPAFRAVFISVGAARVPRTCIYRFLDSSDWVRFQNTNARLLLFLAFSSSSAVGTPRTERVPAPASIRAESDESSNSSGSESIDSV